MKGEYKLATFKYQAKDKAGKLEKGTIEASDKMNFLADLRQKELYCINYTEVRTIEKAAVTTKIPMKQLVVLSRQFATMLQAGVSLIKCIDILYQQTEEKKVKNILLNIYEDVQKGNALSTSLKAQGKAFPNLFISMVECGEGSGTLDTALVRLADHYEKENKLQNKVKNAMIYPMILGVVSIVVIIILLIFVIPTFAEIFADYGELPLATQILLNLSNAIRTNGGMVVGGLVCVAGCVYFIFKMPAAKRWFDKSKLTMPKIGPLNQIVLSARFAETTATLYATGMSLMDVMDITQRVLNNSYIDEGFEKAKEEVQRGVPLSEAMKAIDAFPAMLPNMILIGEESGRLEEILEKTSNYYQEEADTAIQKMVALLEPVMIIVLGIMVAIMIGSILPPMYEMMGNIQ